MKPIAALACLAVLAAACGAADEDVVALPGVEVAADLQLEVVHDGLDGPTQLTVDGDGAVVVAVLNGGEDDGLGEVVRLAGPADSEDRGEDRVQVLRDGLDKPTGIAVIGDELWVMERDRLTRGPIGAEPIVVADDLPNNGRSEGTLTVTPEGAILFDTSGSKRGAVVTDGSGRLFTGDPTEVPGTPVELASGFKHAYAHVFDDDGTLWTTEMSDGRFDGERAADEVLAVVPGADHGWPRCVGDNRPVAEFGGTVDTCEGTPPSLAVFAPGATPTSVAVSPFDPDTLLVALWVEGRIVAVDTASDDPTAVTDVVTGLQNPQHLVTVGDEVLVSEFGAGRILRLRRS